MSIKSKPASRARERYEHRIKEVIKDADAHGVAFTARDLATLADAVRAEVSAETARALFSKES